MLYVLDQTKINLLCYSACNNFNDCIFVDELFLLHCTKISDHFHCGRGGGVNVMFLSHCRTLSFALNFLSFFQELMYEAISSPCYELDQLLRLSGEVTSNRVKVLHQSVITDYFSSVKKRAGNGQKFITDYFFVVQQNLVGNFELVPGVSKLVKNSTQLLVQSLIDEILCAL